MEIKEIDTELKRLKSEVIRLTQLRKETVLLAKKEFLESLTEELTVGNVDMSEQYYNNRHWSATNFKVFDVFRILKEVRKTNKIATHKIGVFYQSQHTRAIGDLTPAAASNRTYKVIRKWKVKGYLRHSKKLTFQCYFLLLNQSQVEDGFIVYSKVIS